MKILYVDDDQEDREIFTDAVRVINASIKCSLASNGAEALLLLRSEPIPDYIFLDINMPVMTGKEFLKNIKADATLASIPVVMYSTSNNQNDKVECNALGAADYIVKPNTFKAICDVIRSVIRSKIQIIL